MIAKMEIFGILLNFSVLINHNNHNPTDYSMKKIYFFFKFFTFPIKFFFKITNRYKIFSLILAHFLIVLQKFIVFFIVFFNKKKHLFSTKFSTKIVVIIILLYVLKSSFIYKIGRIFIKCKILEKKKIIKKKIMLI